MKRVFVYADGSGGEIALEENGVCAVESLFKFSMLAGNGCWSACCQLEDGLCKNSKELLFPATDEELMPGELRRRARLMGLAFVPVSLGASEDGRKPVTGKREELARLLELGRAVAEERPASGVEFALEASRLLPEAAQAACRFLRKLCAASAASWEQYDLIIQRRGDDLTADDVRYFLGTLRRRENGQNPRSAQEALELLRA